MMHPTYYRIIMPIIAYYILCYCLIIDLSCMNALDGHLEFASGRFPVWVS